MTERLAELFQKQQTPVLWMRLAPADRDPGALLESLVSGLAEKFPAIAASVLEQMRQQPGPLYGWGPLFARYARALAAAVPDSPTRPRGLPTEQKPFGLPDPPFSIVLEHVDQLNATPHTLAMLTDYFLPLLPPGSTRVLTRHVDPRRARLPGYIHQVGAQALRLDERDCLALAHDSCVRLPARTLKRMAAITEGREVVISGLLSACQLLSSETIQKMIESANSLPDLLARVARCFLDASPPGTAALMDLALHIEPINPALIQAALNQAVEPPELFLQSLSGGWARLRCTWKEPLRSVIRPGETIGRETLEHAARFLIRQGDYQQAIPLLLDLGEAQEAARVIVQVVEPLMDLGQWETLEVWLKRLPEPVRRDWPWLVYTEGELAIARGQSRPAQKVFSSATRLFLEHRDLKGACQSLLTEGCLSVWQDDLSQAEVFARKSRSLAENAGLSWHQGWADWQLGCLSASAGRLTESLAYFNSAWQSAERSGDAQMMSFISQASQLVKVQIEQQQLKAQHMQAYYEADRAEHEAAGRMRFLLENPSGQSSSLLSQYGWSQTPLFLKLPPPSISNSAIPGADRILGLLRSFLKPSATSTNEVLMNPLTAQTGILASGGSGAADIQPPVSVAPLPVTGDFSLSVVKLPETAAGEPDNPRSINSLNSSVSEPSFVTERAEKSHLNTASSHRLNVYLLGTFRVMIDDQPVDALPSGRSRAVFAYLLWHATNPVAREVIMDTFWPDASPESARNSLNVAIYSLRQALKSIVDLPIILFQENKYLLNPAITAWLDTAAFEQLVQSGHEQEARGRLAESTRDYERALSLYQGDLLTDFPYEDWVAIERERLRILYLETLDRLSLIYFSQGQYAACVSLCQRMLAHDSSREDAHCRLMRCYSRQGQNHLALRQYQACIEALHSELDVEPSLLTTQIYEQIRRRETV